MVPVEIPVASAVLDEYDTYVASDRPCRCSHPSTSVCTLSCTHLARKVPNTGENLAQSGPILIAPRGWKTRQEWRNISDYRGAGDGNRTRVISLED